MNKKEKKANMRLAEAREFAASVNVTKPVAVTKEKEKEEEKPIVITGRRIVEADITKKCKGHFVVTVYLGGQRIKVDKRFKSITKAQEWLREHGTIECKIIGTRELSD